MPVSVNQTILKNHGGLLKNDLTNILTVTSGEEEESRTLLQYLNSLYYSTENISDALKNKKDSFSILSLNCQSIHAKFDKITIFLENLNQ